jgi:hypothetical protein
MQPEIKAATFEWFSSLLIGTTPLAAHFILHIIADPTVNWADSWTGETLFVSITNSGLSAVTVFSRVTKGALKISGSCNVIMAFTLILFLFSGMMYGVVAIGHAKDMTIWPAVALLLASAVVSLVFEIAIAK